MKEDNQQPTPPATILRYHVEIPIGNDPSDVTWTPATILAYAPPHPFNAIALCEGTGFRLVMPPSGKGET